MCIVSVYMVYTMVQSSVVTTRIKKEVKETLEDAGVNIPSAIREHLEDLAWKLQLNEETKKLSKILEKVEPSEKGSAAKSVREDRESH